MSAYQPYPTSAASNAPDPGSVAAVPLASRGRRFAAILIDGLIVWIPSIVIIVVLAIALSSGAETSSEEEDIVAGVFILMAIGVSVAYVFAYLCLLLQRDGAHNGQTLGKQLMGVRVVSADGRPITYSRAVKREFLGTSLPNLITGLYGLLDYGWGMFDDRRACLHDKIASTYVIRADAPFTTGQPLFPPLPYAQPPMPAYGQQQPPVYGQQPPAPPYGQQPAPAREPLPHEAPKQQWAPPSPHDRVNDDARRAFGDG